MVVERVRRVKEALGTEVSYSLKANPSVGLCQLIAREGGAGGEVASSGELVVARAAGFEPDDIVFAGPGKTDDELRMIVREGDRKSTRLNSSHANISYAVFCLKKKI